MYSMCVYIYIMNYIHIIKKKHYVGKKSQDPFKTESAKIWIHFTIEANSYSKSIQDLLTVMLSSVLKGRQTEL